MDSDHQSQTSNSAKSSPTAPSPSMTEPTPNADFARNNLEPFQAVLRARRSIRVYTGAPIPTEIMRDALNDATLAPTSSNLQTFELFWVRDANKRAELAKACLSQPAATTAGELIVVVSRWDLWDRNRQLLLEQMQSQGKKLPASAKAYYEKLIPKVMRRDPFGLMNLARRIAYTTIGFKRPMVRSPVSDADFRIYGHIQASLVAQTFMLSLAAHGYDSCPMGGFDEVRVKALLDLPRLAEVTMVISAGQRKSEGLYGPRHRLDARWLIKEV